MSECKHGVPHLAGCPFCEDETGQYNSVLINRIAVLEDGLRKIAESAQYGIDAADTATSLPYVCPFWVVEVANNLLDGGKA